jgi:hypothetical protein
MKVRDFLGYFSEEDLDKELLLSSDAEGNSYHPVHEVCTTEDGKLVVYPTDEWVDVDDGLEEEETGTLGEFLDEWIDKEQGTEESNAPHSKDNSEGGK